ncbi:MAG: MerR family transcriptional regulator [Chloroflexota bacterium]
MKSPGLYPIGIVAELLDLRPETIRVWDREGFVEPQRRRGLRCFSDDDVQRLAFVKHLVCDQGLNGASVRAYLDLYPCWSSDACHPRLTSAASNGKPCWKRPNKYCGLAEGEAQTCQRCAAQPTNYERPPLPSGNLSWLYSEPQPTQGHQEALLLSEERGGNNSRRPG